MPWRKGALVAASAVWALVAVPVQAQVPGPANPGRIDERFTAPPSPQSVPEIEVPEPSAAAPPDKAADIRFTLRGLSIEGSSVFREKDFAPLSKPLAGKEISLLDIYRLRDAITAKYRAAGYILSQAIIPPQKIMDGVVRLQIVEGYVSDVTFEGNANDPRGLLAAMAEKIERSHPLRNADLERYVLLMGDLPGVAISTVIRPGKEPGAATLVVLVHRAALQAQASADNHGSLAIGPEEFSGDVEANSLLGLDEQTGVQVATAASVRELQYFSVHHDETLTAEGLKLSLSANVSRSHPGGAISELNPFGTGETYRIRLSEPLLRSRAQTLTVGAGFAALNSTTDLAGAPFSTDRLRVLFLDAGYDYADTFVRGLPASTIVSVELDRGVAGFGASTAGSANLSHADGRPDFTKLFGQITRVQSVSRHVSVAGTVSGQVSDNALLTPEEFGLGGGQIGRGYEPSELLGDDGVGFSIEGRYALPDAGVLSRPQLYAFYDAGEVWMRSPAAGQAASASLASLGAGIRFAMFRHLTADLAVAKPLTRDIASRRNRDVRPLFALTTAF